MALLISFAIWFDLFLLAALVLGVGLLVIGVWCLWMTGGGRP